MKHKQRNRRANWIPAICGATATALLALGAWHQAWAAKPREITPSVRLPLADLGFPGYASALMRAGASMATVHVLDGKHILFTYSSRSLVHRLPGDDANDQDREVEAVLLEVPNGKVLGRTRWRLHDHGRYLWSVGRGVFVLRTGDELSLFSPMRGLAAGDPFLRTTLLHRPGRPVLLSASPDAQILTVELQSRDKQAEAGDAEPAHKRTTMEFFRFEIPAKAGEPISVRPAGAIGAPGLMQLALDGDGYLWAEDTSRSDWQVSFNEYEGKSQNLAAVHSSCTPRLHLLSRSEFAVVTCGAVQDGSGMLAAYGFDGHENWQEPFGDELQPATFVAAPEAGRFAMSRLYASGDGSALSGMGTEDSSLVQEIRVYGTESGDMLFHLQCQPVVRSPENFDLSADGRTLAVLGTKSLDVYTLPELTTRDRKDLEDVRGMMPPEAHGAVHLTRITRPIDPAGPEETGRPSQRRMLTANGEAVPMPAPPGTSTPGAAVPEATVPGAAAAGSVSSASQVRASAPAAASGAAEETGVSEGAAGDGNGPRKAPTLLNPGETPEFKPKNSAPE